MEDVFHLGIKAIIRNKEGKVLLLQVNPEKLIGNQHGIYWDIPGGRIQKGSTIEQTLKREVAEETGITVIKSFQFLTATLANIRIPTKTGEVGLILFAYLCEVENSEVITLSNEHSNYQWTTPTESSQLLKVKYPEEFTQKIKELKHAN